MSSRSDGEGTNTANASHALLPFERKALQEARSYTTQCENDIHDNQENFNGKGSWGLWWDAKGLFNSSDKEEVIAHMEKYRKFYEETDEFFEKVEKGEAHSYEELIDVYDKIEKMEKDAENDVKDNRSKAVCRRLRMFLDEKYKLDHNVKKVECVILRKQIRAVEQDHQSTKQAYVQLNKKMDQLIEDNRNNLERMASEAEERCEAIRRESEERMKQLLKESEERFREMKKENDELRSEAEKNRLESEERLKKAVEEADKRSESRMEKMVEKSDVAMKLITKMLEDMVAS